MEINSRRKFLLSEEKVIAALVLLAVPSIIAMLTTALYNFVDTLFVSMLKSTAMIAAVTVSFPMVMIMSAIGQGIGIGAGSLISRQLGKKDYGSVERSVFTGMLMAIVFSALGMALLIGNLSTILPWLVRGNAGCIGLFGSLCDVDDCRYEWDNSQHDDE